MPISTHVPCSEFSQAHRLPVEHPLPELAAGTLRGESQHGGRSACDSLNRSLGAAGRVSEERGKKARSLERDRIIKVIFDVFKIFVFM